MKIRPLTGQALIEILPDESRTPGGIELPQISLSAEAVQETHTNPTKPRPLTGIVREIGQWPTLDNGMSLMPEFGRGARVIVGFNSGVQMQRNIGERFRMVKISDVIAVLH